MGSMIFEEVLQLSTNRVVSLKLLMIILSACWAPSVKLSASSKTIILVLPGGRATFFWANDLICSRTTSIPRSSDALSSRVASLYWFSRIYRTMQSTLDVLPTPGGPVRIRLGILPWATQARSVLICYTFPNTSLRVLGRYFSSQIYFMGGKSIIINPISPSRHIFHLLISFLHKFGRYWGFDDRWNKAVMAGIPIKINSDITH